MNLEESRGMPLANGGAPHANDTIDKVRVIVNDADPPSTVRAVRDVLAATGRIFDRGTPTKIVQRADGAPPTAIALTADEIVCEVHSLCQVVRLDKHGSAVPATLPTRIARMYLATSGDWQLPPLTGICTSPLLSPDGSIRTATGYDPSSSLWCVDIPGISIPERPTRADAEAALLHLRRAFQTFAFADAPRRRDPALGIYVVNVDLPPGLDESACLVGLMTAVCRTSLPLAPGFLVRASEISSSGTGKGLLIRGVCAVAFGFEPGAFTPGGDRRELEKQLASVLMEGAPAVLLDNVNGSLRSDMLALILSERRVGARVLGSNRMATLSSTSFIGVTGNGLAIFEDLARRFVVSELDARCENPEQRPFEPGLLEHIASKRAQLLSAALTIWRWGRQNLAEPGLPLGGFEKWCTWCRDPLLALGCRDPIERVEHIKADDPARRWLAELFERWYACHGSEPLMSTHLAEPVQAILDPRRRGSRHIAARLAQLVNARAGGFLLTQDRNGGQGAPSYTLLRSSDAAERLASGGLPEAGDDALPSAQPNHAPIRQGHHGAGPHDNDFAPITIDLKDGSRIHVTRDFDAGVLERVLDVLRRRP
jgi:hypothetical protein